MFKIGGECGDLRRFAKNNDEWFAMAKECGFDSIDYGFWGSPNTDFILNQDDDAIQAFCKELKATADRQGVYFGQAHAPAYLPWDLDPDRYFDEEYVKLFINSIKATAWIDCPYLVFHPIMFMDPENNFFKSIDYNKRFFEILKPYALEYGVTICIENMCALNPLRNQGVPSNSSSAEKLSYLIDQLGEGFGACLDTGHAFFCGQEPGKFARLLGSRLKVLHMQDSDGVQDIHVPPTYGYADWQDFLKALKEINFQGILNMEVSFQGALNCKCSYKPLTKEPLIAIGKYQVALAKDFAKYIENL